MVSTYDTTLTVFIWGTFPQELQKRLERVLNLELERVNEIEEIPENGIVLVQKDDALDYQRAALRAGDFPTAYIIGNSQDFPSGWGMFFDEDFNLSWQSSDDLSRREIERHEKDEYPKLREALEAEF